MKKFLVFFLYLLCLSYGHVASDTHSESRAAKKPETKFPGVEFFAGKINDVTFKLIEETLEPGSNLVISPLSVFVPLSLSYLGSDERTKDELEEVLTINDKASREHIHIFINALITRLRADAENHTLWITNGMFLKQNSPVDADFEEDAKKYYYAKIRNLDFRNSQLSLRRINDWVSQETNGTIRSIINSPPPPMSSLIHMNAAYFDGIWKFGFPQRLTSPGRFYPINEDEKEVLFMRIHDGTFPLYQSDEHQHTFIKLPYENDEYSMIIALPYSREQQPMPMITDEILRSANKAMVDTKIGTVAIPKFRMENRKSLIGSMQKLGVNDVFDENAVDLSKLRKENDVYVSAIIHKAMVQVNEKGAKPSTSTSMSPSSNSREGADFIADHPFSFYIVHEFCGLAFIHGKLFDFDTIVRGK